MIWITLTVIVPALWAFYNIPRTLTQRRLRRAALINHRTLEVSYDQHFWALMTSKNPNKLYEQDEKNL